MAKAPTINIGDSMRDVTATIHVTGVHRARVRIWLGCKVIAFAARVMGVKSINVVVGDV